MNSFSKYLGPSTLPALHISNDKDEPSLVNLLSPDGHPAEHKLQSSPAGLQSAVPGPYTAGLRLRHDQRPVWERGVSEGPGGNVWRQVRQVRTISALETNN